MHGGKPPGDSGEDRGMPGGFRIVRLDTGEVVAESSDPDVQEIAVGQLASEQYVTLGVEVWDPQKESWVRLKKAPLTTPFQRLAAGLIALVVVGGVVAFILSRVCEEQLTQSGEAVTICRHIQASDPPVIAVGLIALVALGAFFNEISGFGFSLKREVRHATETAEAANRNSAAATKTAKSAEGKAIDARRHSEGVQDTLDFGESSPTPPEDIAAEAAKAAERAQQAAQEAQATEDLVEREGPAPSPSAPITPYASRIEELAADYNRIRATMPSGRERTAEMERIVRDMIGVLGELQQFDVANHLQSNNRGLRLAGYAYLYKWPALRWLPNLVDAIESEDKPFGQYWGLCALREQVKAEPGALDEGTRRRLEDLRSKLPSGSDRAFQLREALDRLSR
jgi:hypothetical protein